MNKQTNTNRFTRSSIALALGMGILLPVAATATEQSKKPMKSGEHILMMEKSDTSQAVDVKMKKQDHQAMKEQRTKMMAEMKGQDSELNAQVAMMNSASMDRKLDLMADIITKLVEQRAASHEQMATMPDGVMDSGATYIQPDGESVSPQPIIRTTDEAPIEVAKSPESKKN